MSDSLIYVWGLVAYDGTDYHGFQLQPDVPTIQGTLEEALQTVTGLQIRVIGAGRTDTGVHASGQVVAMHVPWRHSVQSLQRALNVQLPPSVTIHRMGLAAPGFHPRFSAISRTYRYTLYDRAFMTDAVASRYSPLTDRFALYVPRVLDLNAMQTGVGYLIGEHDFATFGQPTQGENTVRRLYRAEWQVAQANIAPLTQYPGRCLVFTVCANGFLRQMVRNLVGVSLAVGRGQWHIDDVKAALAARDRSRCAPPAPAKGLVLEAVSYEADLNL